MNHYIKNTAQRGEIALYEALNKLASIYNEQFSILELPYALELNANTEHLLLPFYDGEDYAHRWNEADGGSGIKLTFAEDIPQVISDLSKISIDELMKNPELNLIENLVFDESSAREYFTGLAYIFRKTGLLTDEEYAKVIEILATPQTSTKILNNGDFYPRNFIRRPNGKLVLIDWETWNDHSPFFTIDHPENAAAVMYAHMWGNPVWQATFRHNLVNSLGMNEASLRKVIVMKALQLANLWHTKHKKQELVDNQICLVKAELNDQ